MVEGELRRGLRVVFAREIRTPSFRTARAFESATVVRTLDPSSTSNADQRVEVEYHGERFVVQRADLAPPLAPDRSQYPLKPSIEG